VQIPLHRAGKSEELARSIMFLLSDETSYVTGTAIPVDGGSLARM
jgi:NAD(P)-dependent dehydrogenase (short-subunit alcohol dehydrogenase family)